MTYFRLAISSLTFMVLAGPGACGVQAQAKVYSEKTRKTVATVVRQDLAGELVRLDDDDKLKHEETRKVKIDLGGLGVVKSEFDAKISVRAKFDDPKKNLKLDVPSLVRPAPGTVRGKLTVSCPVRGTVAGGVPGIDLATGFSAKAIIEVDCEVAMSHEKEAVNYAPRVLSSKLEVADLKFDDEIANVLSGPARDVANALLEGNRATIEAKANDALRKAFESGKLRSSGDVILDFD